MKNIVTVGIAIVALLVAGASYFAKPAPQLGAAAGPDFYNKVFFRSGMEVPTTNTATSTSKVGCIQSVATSTATPIHLEYSTTTSLATYSGGAVPNGGVSWRYGACPI